MKNQDKWKASKFVFKKGKLVGSRNSKEVGVGSRLVVDLFAAFYETALKEHARGKLLDLGCGKVPLYDAYVGYIRDITCIDWENTLHKNEHLDIQCDLTKRLPISEELFDTIILSDVLEHIPEPQHLWNEMSRVLTKGGKVLLSVPFYYWLHEVPYDYYRYTEFALRRFANNSGLRIIQLDAIGGAPEILADIISKNIVRVPAVGPSIASFIQWLTLAFVKTKFGANCSRTTRKNFPFGYFLVAEKPLVNS